MKDKEIFSKKSAFYVCQDRCKLISSDQNDFYEHVLNPAIFLRKLAASFLKSKKFFKATIKQVHCLFQLYKCIAMRCKSESKSLFS